jgi:hypothetical protein
MPVEPLQFLQTLQVIHGSPLGDNEEWTNEEVTWNNRRSGQMGLDPESWPTKHSVREFQEHYIDNYLKKPILETLTGEEREVIAHTPVGFKNFPSLNGEARLTSDGSPVIVLNQGLLALTSFWWESKASHLEVFRNEGPGAAELYLLDTYSFVLLYYAKGGQLGYPDEFIPISEPAMEVVLRNSLQTELFVLAHEVAHVLCGHLQPTSAPTSSSGISSQAKEEELEADVRGFRIYFDALMHSPLFSEAPRINDIFVILEYFALLQLVERNPESVPSWSAETHPTAFERVMAVASPFLLSDTPEQGELKHEILDWIEGYFKTIPNLADHFTESGTWLSSVSNADGDG